MFSVPDLEVDVDSLKSENLYEKLSVMCHEYVSDLKDEDEENILQVAVKHDLFNIFKILSTSTTADFNAVNQNGETLEDLVRATFMIFERKISSISIISLMNMLNLFSYFYFLVLGRIQRRKSIWNLFLGHWNTDSNN